MYFEMMPKLFINLFTDQGATTFTTVTDITTRAIRSKEITENLFLYDYYTVKDGETPEIVADNIYNSPTLHWVILLCNDIIDPVYDWVMPSEMLMEHVIATYGADHVYTTHHYEDTHRNWVMPDFPGAHPVSNIDYETAQNEKKREIKILQPRYLNAFVGEVKTKMMSVVL